MADIPKYLTKEEQSRFLEALERGGNKRDIALFKILLRYGLRASEIGLLRLKDIDLTGGRITFTRLKGGIDNIWPLLSDVKEALSIYFEVRRSNRDEVFPGRGPGGLSRQMIWKLMKKYSNDADLPEEKSHPHVLRHTCGVRALEAGLAMEDVQDLLGHRSIMSTTIYAKITSKRREGSAEKLEEAVGG